MRNQRIELIKKYIEEEKNVSLDKLCEIFKVSKNTIRRDINELENLGFVKKVYGGVTLNSQPEVSPLLPYRERYVQNKAEEEHIVKLASELVLDDDIIFIDTGTTCCSLIDYIGNKKCTVITNSMRVCLSAIPYSSLKVIVLPGVLKRETMSFISSDRLNYLEDFNITKAFMTCTGVTVENGLTNASEGEYWVKKAVVENSKSCFLLADHSKFGKFSLMTFCKLNDIDNIITDEPVNEEIKKYCKDNQIKISY